MTTPLTSTFTTAGAGRLPVLADGAPRPRRRSADSGDTSAVTLGLTFSPTVSGFVKGLRYYRDAANTGTHTGRLWGPRRSPRWRASPSSTATPGGRPPPSPRPCRW